MLESGMADQPITRRQAGQILGAAAATPLLAADTPDICFLSAVEMASLIRRKKLSARETMDAHLKQIERLNPKVNSIVTLIADQARENARKADEAQARGATLGPLHGLPVAHKDLVETAGIRTTFGSPVFKDNVPKQDAILVERIKRAGAIAVGKTNTPEFGAGSQTFNAVFGATKNPYDLTKTCGGSSGGAAVSLACGMVPIADGSDSGGSLRNPAAFCSVVGFRTAPGRVPHSAVGNAWATLGVAGPMGRSVADAALLLSVMAGPDARCPISISEPGSRFAGNLERNFKGVRVAWFKDMGGLPFDPRIRAAVDAQRKVFENLGCIVEEAEPDFTGAGDAYDTLRAWGYASSYAEVVKNHRELVKDTVDLGGGTRLETFRRRHRARPNPAQQGVGSHADFHGEVRILHRTQHAGSALRRDAAVRHGSGWRAVAELYGMDEVLLADFDPRESGDFDAVRIYARGIAGGFADRGAASG